MTDAQKQRAPAKSFPIVGIGASAGGLEAFILLLTKMPVDTGMAFVLVQHLNETPSAWSFRTRLR
jgi:two-component system CheB/CheR fusion protein